MFRRNLNRTRPNRSSAKTVLPAFLLLAAFAVVPALAGCEHGGSINGPSHGKESQSGKRAAPEAYAEADSGPGYMDSGIPGVPLTPRGASPNWAPSAPSSPSMATTQTLRVETGDLKKAKEDALRIGAESGASVQQQNEGDNVREVDPTKTAEKAKDYSGYVALGLQIPVDTFDQAVSRLRALGEVTYANSQSTNTSQQSTDLAAEFADVQATIGRLEQLRAQTNDPDVLVKVQNQLTAQHSRLLELQRQQQGLDKRTQTVSLTLTLLGKKPAEPQRGWVSAGLHSGWSDLVATVRWVVTSISWLAVWAAPVVAALIAARLSWRLLRGRRA
ncbi:DUF4349 domain-containing protein [Segniliparus rugosus]|uniref:DUF4349 domain-containing protein n=1 Tax=Segniliparus rugosus (strain ATCC BAA-974 / DSM 45345 / CCUG 50838 / CIP 108380 / JCM 13579 / CDC 945) TaxID=679197 RepID=E5XL73_SEGRC|nr:DUF4349 domain-containing protein [Segniliparus rugosus]EFV14941.1 hypothetical protein HMPREF9336_00242 [Segniliparus rugosus ATCC BAA-974]